MMNDLIQYRLSSFADYSISSIYFRGLFQCWILEDEFRTEKVYGETRIPEGIYPLRLRTFGDYHAIYSQRYPELHKGMIEVMDVPNFTNVLFHPGNDDEDTAACLLPGYSVGHVKRYSNGKIGSSTEAYLDLYRTVIPHIKSMRLIIKDLERELTPTPFKVHRT